MTRLLLLGVGLLLTTATQGQNLLTGKRYTASKLFTARFNSKTLTYYDLSERSGNYLVSAIPGGIQVRTLNIYSATPGPSIANVACRITNLKCVRHSFKSGTLEEEYVGSCSTITAGELLSLPGLPNPSVVEADWEEKSDGTAILHLHWFIGPKKSNKLLARSYYMCNLYCAPY